MTGLQAVMYAKDPQLLADFYCAVCGLDRASGSDAALEAPGIRLDIVRIPDEIADGIVILDPPERREDTPIKLSFPVPDLHAAREAARRLGGVLDGEPWPFQGSLHCDGADPEGNVFQVRARA